MENQMKTLELVRPTKHYRDLAEELKQEYFQNGETVIHGSALLDQLDYDAWLDHIRCNGSSDTVKPGWVPADSFFALRKRDGRIIGMIDIRHNLDNEFLANYGGHIGYAVRPGERGKGYAAHMLRMALDHARRLGLSKVMLGCNADNIASMKTIEKCGGVRTETKACDDGRTMHIFWIEL